MQKTKIEYLTHTWNPIVMKCTRVSVGCANCWHLTMCNRMKNNPKLSAMERCVYAGKCPPFLMEHRLNDPLKLKKPAVIGTQFMGDLFYEDIPTRFIQDTLRIIKLSSQHTFIVLTKRIEELWNQRSYFLKGPLPDNLWLGVSVEDKKTADERIPILLQIPAAVHVVSYEPALNSLYLRQDWLKNIDLLIAGCEAINGKPGRHAKYEWFRSVKDQCVEAGIPFFLKQMVFPVWGEGYKVFKMPTLDGQIWNQMPEVR